MNFKLPPFQPKSPTPQLFAGSQKNSTDVNSDKLIQPLTFPEDFFIRGGDFLDKGEPVLTLDELDRLLDDVGFHKDSYEKTPKSPGQDGADAARLPALKPQPSAPSPKQPEPQSELPKKTRRKPERKRQGLVDKRIALIQDYKNGEKRSSRLAKNYDVKPHTARSWIRRFKKNPETPFFKPTPDSHLREIPLLEPLEAGPHKRRRENEEPAQKLATPVPKKYPDIFQWVLDLNTDPLSPEPASPKPSDPELDAFFDWEAWTNRT